MPTIDDLARLLAMYAPWDLDSDDLLTPAASGSGVVFPDHQTRSLLVYLEDVPAANGGQKVPDVFGYGDGTHDTYYQPPVAWLWWVNNGRLIRRDSVRFTEQVFSVPMWNAENCLIWSCPAPAKLGIWRTFDSAAVWPF